MSKREFQADMHFNIRSVRRLLILLVLSFFLLFGSSCRQDDGATAPTGSTESSCSTESESTSETAEPTQPGETTLPPTVQTQPTEPSEESTVPPTESTVPPTESTVPPTESTEPPTEEPTVPETQPPMEIQISPDRTEVLLIPKNAKAFLSRDLSQPLEYDIYNYKTVHNRLDTSTPVSLSVKITNMPQGLSVTSIVFTLADNAQLIGGRDYRPAENQRYVHVHYLLADKQYYFQARITFSDGTTQVLSSSFRTAAAPRLLTIDGIVNVRDLGGWKTTDGYVIRQGLLYRGSEIDGVKVPEYLLTAEGLRQMREELGIRMDLDLRSASEVGTYTYPLGSDVTHILCDARPYTATFHGPGKNAVYQIFTALADQSNYPVYMHCTYGMDRAGTISFLLEALLGVSEDDMRREYELSTMYHTWVDYEAYLEMVEELKADWEGDTLQEKAEAFVLACGVTQEQIRQIRNILLEKQ